MSKLIKFGEDVEGYDITVLNEREIRAAAGILFLIMFIALWISLSNLKAARTKNQRLLAKWGIIVASLFSLTGIVLLLIFIVNSLKY